MTLRAALVFSAILPLTPLLAREKTDLIVMKNGDRLTCEIKQLEMGVLYLSLDYVDGTISVQWSKVARVVSDQLFFVQTTGGDVYTGKLKTQETAADEPMKIEVVEAAEKGAVIERARVVGLSETSESLWQRFSARLDTGLTYAKGNNATQYNVAAQLSYRKERWSAQTTFNSSFTGNNSSSTTTKDLGFAALRYLRWNNWYYSGLGDFLQSSEQNINLQTRLGGGIGHFFKNTNRARVGLLGGLAWQQTSYQEGGSPVFRQEDVAGMVAASIQVFWFKKSDLDIQATLLPFLTQPGRLRMYLNATYSVKLFPNFWWKFSFYDNFDSHPPSNFSGTDLGTTSGISWTFN